MKDAENALKEEIRAAEAQMGTMENVPSDALREAVRRQYEAVRQLRDNCPHERVVERCDNDDQGCDAGADPEGHPHWYLCAACGRHHEIWLNHPEWSRENPFTEDNIVRVSDIEFWEVHDAIPGRFITDGDLGWGFEFYWQHLWD